MKLVISKTRIQKCDSIHLTSGMVGQTVDVEFSEDWDGLNKVAVFTNGKITKDVINPTDSLTIPWEVLAEPNKTASVGFYGYRMVNGEKVLAIPTIYIDLGRIDKGADPSGDPSAEPTPTVAEQLQSEVNNHEERITELEAGGGGGGSAILSMRVEDGYIQYSTDDATWINLIAVSELKGNKGDAFTYEDFTPEQLAALKGTPGNDGESAYQIAVDAGFEGSQAEWLASLKGSPGYTPEKGRDYFDGKDGLTPYIGTNGNWFIGPLDTGAPSRGANGETPQKGVDYFTDADKTELVSAVLAALPDGDEVSY